MKKFRIIYFSVIFLISCNQPESIPEVQITRLDYPSASTIEYYDGRLYIIGDDAINLLVLDIDLKIIDSMPVILYTGRRIPKDVKPDLEASTIYMDNKDPVLFLFGSGSLEPYRNAGWKYHLQSRTKENIYLQSLYSKIKEAGIKEVNIEGACYLAGKLILANRGNKGNPSNELVIVDEGFLRNDSSYQVSVIPFEIQKDTASFKGISGMTYAKQNDQLIMTVSTEDTRNSYEDGAIGKSYLWIITDISSKLKIQSLKPERVIDLEEIDDRFKGHKIESAVVINETDNRVDLVLAADNDDGSSTLFKMSLKKD